MLEVIALVKDMYGKTIDGSHGPPSSRLPQPSVTNTPPPRDAWSAIPGQAPVPTASSMKLATSVTRAGSMPTPAHETSSNVVIRLSPGFAAPQLELRARTGVLE